jgi:hypothetical protein
LQTRIWNEFSRKAGWNDALSRTIEKQKREEGLGTPPGVVTAFDLIDFDEGRGPAPPGSPPAIR